jgi:hydroxyacylglutathione hydrolase
MHTVEPIHAFSDNYVWLVSAPGSDAVVVVDPGEAEPVLTVLDERGLSVAAILLTHHHEDHVGGVDAILSEYPAPVYGPAIEKISSVDHPVAGGDGVSVPQLGLDLEVADVPGHTAGHVAYLGPGRAFVGDTLFAGGCGRVFEGTPEQMYNSLQTLGALSPATTIYCAHEYTATNLRFAFEVEPGNQALTQRMEDVRAARAQGRPTVPSTLVDELATNPFMRCGVPEVKAAAERRVGRRLDRESDIFAVVRRWKDGWTGNGR